jgi:Phosphatase
VTRMPGPASPAPSRDELAAQLVTARIAGAVTTSRENNLANYRRLAARDPGYLFGLQPRGAWGFDDVLALMARRCGVSADPAHEVGEDTIDVELTLDRLDALADRVRAAAQARARVLVATGHPTGLLAVHVELAGGLRAAGCTLLAPEAAWRDGDAQRERHIRFLLGVAVASQGAHLLHTHSPVPMELMLADLERAGEPAPDLVIADHGFAGAAGRAGITTVGFADSNDPALFVGEDEGDVAVCVPLDDNVRPHLYAPMAAYLVRRAFG